MWSMVASFTNVIGTIIDSLVLPSLDVKAGSKGKERFRRPLRGTRDLIGSTESLSLSSDLSFSQLVSLTPFTKIGLMHVHLCHMIKNVTLSDKGNIFE
jgi:hypothetical protein